MDRLRLSQTEIAFVRRGRGTPLVLLHGFPLDHTMWSAQLEGLAEDFQVIAPDLRGFGQSGVTPGTLTMARFADDLAELLDALAIAQRVVLCGLSMGGYIALAFWRQYAARLAGLVLCDTRATPDTPQAAADRLQAAERVLREGPVALADTMVPKLFARATRAARPQLVEAIRHVILGTSREGIAAAARGMAERPDMTGQLAEIRCPTLVLVGGEDLLSPPAEMRSIADAIPDARFVEIPRAAHMTPLEQPTEVNRAITQMLRSLA